jgi:hypothetical protein
MSESFKENIKQLGESGQLGEAKSDRFKFVEGDNRFRILSPFRGVESAYKNEDSSPRMQFASYILDRTDGKIKLGFFPKTVMIYVKQLSVSEDYAFDELPMPFDITVTAKNAGKKEVEYAFLPSPKRDPLTPEQLAAYTKETPIDEVVSQIAAARNTEATVGAVPEGEITVEEALKQ